ncbi:MAG: hypothetical protein RI979_680, partial [Pseudomonadota bacterium]
NSGRATKEGSIEDTALKTNLEAADEVARQLRLRDLAGLIVIDFIDMEERRNNAAVEKRLKDKLKTDRARIQVGRISGFGLMEMSRQRLRPGMLESTTQPCPHCHGTGLIRSNDSMALQVLRALEEEGTRKRSKEVLLKAPIGIVNFLFNQKREHIALIEARYGMSVRIEADPSLISPDYAIEKFKTATRFVPEHAPVISGHAGLMGDPVDEADEDIVEDDIVEEAEAEGEAVEVVASSDNAEGNGGNRKRRRRRRRRKPGGAGAAGEGADNGGQDDGQDDVADEEDGEGEADGGADDAVTEVAAEPTVPAKRGVTRSRKPAAAPKAAKAEVEAAAEAAPKPRSRSRSAKPKADAEPIAAEVVAEVAEAPVAEPVAEAPAKPKATRSRAKPKAAEPVAEPTVAEASFPADPVLSEPAPSAALVPDPQDTVAPPPEDGPPKPRKKGWWSAGR